METNLDIAIVGGGPAGLSAAINGIYRKKTVRLFSSEKNYLERAELVNNYLGMEEISGRDMMQQFRQQARNMGVAAEAGRVTSIMPMDQGFMIAFNSDIVQAKTVIIASGAAHQKAISGEAAFLGRGLSYCATCDGALYKQRRVIVCGDADDLPEEANFLQELGVDVTVILPRQRPEALREDIAFLQDRVVAVDGKMQVTKVELQSGKSLDIHGVFLLHNSLAPAALLRDVAMKDGFVQVSRQMETNIAGLFACGDCTGIPLQIAKAVGEGLIAGQQAAKYIDSQRK